MLAPILDETKHSFFKFWFEDHIHDGFYYQNELFYRFQTLAVDFRTQLYHLACQLAQHESVVVTVTYETCSVWVSFQRPNADIVSKRSQMIQRLEYFENLDQQPLHHLPESAKPALDEIP